MSRTSLGKGRALKFDEFYTRYQDVADEMQAYIDYDPDVFRGKVVYNNCDDPRESNFFKYFVMNFERLGLRRLIATGFKSSLRFPAMRMVVSEVKEVSGSSWQIVEQLAQYNDYSPLKGNGDFRDDECVELLEQADVCVTNPPFSLFREHFAQVMRYKKECIVVGPVTASGCSTVVPYLKNGTVKIGAMYRRGSMWFVTPHKGTFKQSSVSAWWYSSLEHGIVPSLRLRTMDENRWSRPDLETLYRRYDNYDAIEVPQVKLLPRDYDGIMGVPLTFWGHHNPVQFEVVGGCNRSTVPPGWKFAGSPLIDGKPPFGRVFIQRC